MFPPLFSDSGFIASEARKSFFGGHLADFEQKYICTNSYIHFNEIMKGNCLVCFLSIIWFERASKRALDQYVLSVLTLLAASIEYHLARNEKDKMNVGTRSVSQ